MSNSIHFGYGDSFTRSSVLQSWPHTKQLDKMYRERQRKEEQEANQRRLERLKKLKKNI